MVAVVLHATQSEGVLAIGGQVDIELGGQLGSREVDVGIVLGRNVASIMAQHFQQEAASIREVDSISHSLDSAVALRAIGHVVVERQNLGVDEDVGGRGDGLGGRVHREHASASGGANFILGSQSAIGVDDVQEGDFRAGSANGNMLQGNGSTIPNGELFGASDLEGRIGGSRLLLGTALGRKQAEVEQRVGSAEFALLIAFDFLLYHVRYA